MVRGVGVLECWSAEDFAVTLASLHQRAKTRSFPSGCGSSRAELFAVGQASLPAGSGGILPPGEHSGQGRPEEPAAREGCPAWRRGAPAGGVFQNCPAHILIENSLGGRKISIMQAVFTGPVYVVRDNIDTDQIIPAQYLTLVPTIPDEYEKLGSYALCGLPDALYPTRFVKEGQLDSDYSIVVGGKNFGFGSSSDHGPIALGSAGCKIVLAESFARIFFRNAFAIGQLYPCEC